MSTAPLDADTLERLVPDQIAGDDVTRATLELHLERYRFAADYLTPGATLDIACGVGYGSRLLADLRPDDVRVLGVDLSSDAVGYARERYGDDRVSFECADAMTFRSEESFDNIVSLETIEHLPDPAGFVINVLQLLKPGGVFVASVPTTPSVDANPHHLHDFTRRRLDALVAGHGLVEIASLPQVHSFGLGSVLTGQDSRSKNVRPHLLLYYLQHPYALMKRVASTVRFGFVNRYVTVAWRSET